MGLSVLATTYPFPRLRKVFYEGSRERTPIQGRVARLMMRKWRSPAWAMLAIVALFATILPAHAWSCPMTGRTGDATTVCRSKAATGAETILPCCRHMASSRCLSKCCKSVSLPSSNQPKKVALGLTQIRTVLTSLAQQAQVTQTLVMLPAPLSMALHFGLATVSNASLTYPSQLNLHTLAGRAPPAV